MTSQDICSPPGTRESFPPRPRALGSPTTVSSALWQPFTAVSPPGDLLAPALQMNSTSAQPGTTVVLQCILPVVSPVIRIIFCKDGKEQYSQKAHQGQLSYSLVLNITSRSAGIYTCGYQQRNEMKQRRSSALSAGRILNVPGETRPRAGGVRRDGGTCHHMAVLRLELCAAAGSGVVPPWECSLSSKAAPRERELLSRDPRVPAASPLLQRWGSADPGQRE